MKEIISYEMVPYFTYEHAKRDSRFNMNFNHYHTEYEIYYLAEGERVYCINGKLYEVNAGDLVVIPSNAFHTTLAAKKDYHDRYLLYIKDNFFIENTAIFGGEDGGIFLNDHEGVYHLEPWEQKKILGLFRMIEEAQLGHMSCYKTEIYAVCVQIMTMCISHILGHTKIGNLKMDVHQDKALQIAAYMDEHYASIRHIEELGEMFYLSKFHMCRIFKETTKLTINEYLTITRMNAAAVLLETTDHNITEISEQTGFRNLSTFEKAFKKFYKETPMEYRKYHGNQCDAALSLTENK